ncbi:MAG: VWA domain-containing protein [Armatimonadetes bacterium]|nr:VWA domain-containing protein [Armatimonadota bacterium]
MAFLWPSVLWSLLALPALAWAYAWALRRRAVQTVAHPHLTLLAAAAVRPAWRRHVSAACLLLALAAVIVAAARPVAMLPLPSNQSAIILSIDTSGSMRSEDMRPNRFEAAKEAARAFVAALPRSARIGVVAFSGYATLVQSPTRDRRAVQDTIASLRMGPWTAIGDGLLEAVRALPGREQAGPATPVPPAGVRLPAGVVVLLSDGRSNRGVSNEIAAEIARAYQVKTYTVGIGQTYPVNDPNAFVIGGTLDEESLRAIAAATGGEYFHASSAEELRRVYRHLGAVIGWNRQETETGALAALVAFLLTGVAVALSVRFSVLLPAMSPRP